MPGEGSAMAIDERHEHDPLAWLPWLLLFVGLLPFAGFAIRGYADNFELGVAAAMLTLLAGTAWLHVRRSSTTAGRRAS